MQVYVYHWHILRGEEECTTHQYKNTVSRESRRIFAEMMKRISEMTNNTPLQPENLYGSHSGFISFIYIYITKLVCLRLKQMSVLRKAL